MSVILQKLAMSPTTPQSRVTSTPPKDSPTGTWRHPRLDEIARRRRANTFGERNVTVLVWNVAALGASFAVYGVFRRLLSQDDLNSIATFVVYPTLLRWLIRAIPIYNIAFALWPLVHKPDELEDIPLTPSQRALLGLSPGSAPQTPDSIYITPPRYSRSATPQSSGAQRRGSPLNARDRGSPKSQAGSPFNQASNSLLQKAIGAGPSRRHSHGSSAPGESAVGFGHSSGWPSAPSTPTPSGGKHASVGLNSKWLYERGRSSLGGQNYHI